MNVSDPDFTFESFRELVRGQDDSFHNSLCVGADGGVYFHTWGNGIKRPPFPKDGFRFETFCMGNEYVGDSATGDREFVSKLFSAIKFNWARGTVGYLDAW